jgi:hypothetical protein
MTNMETLPLPVLNPNGSSTLAQLRRVIICAGTGCMANGAMKVFELRPAGDPGTSRRSYG